MSLVMSVYTKQDIVMAADSRLTLTFPKLDLCGAPLGSVSTPSSDSATKLFLLGEAVGVSTYGIATVGGSPIAGAIETFSVERDLVSQSLSPEAIASELLAYFTNGGARQATCFHVGGYAKAGDAIDQQLWLVDLQAATVSRLNQPSVQGANWGGEIDILQRLFNDVGLIQPPNASIAPIPFFATPFEHFTLQDAIDYCLYAVRTTIDTIRFQNREKTVGGPIDVLVLSPSATKWIAKKELHAGL